MRAHGPGYIAAERRKTVLIVTIAVILVVAAVLAGAFILRGKVQTTSEARAPLPPDSLMCPDMTETC